MFFRAIAAKPSSSDLEFLGCIAKGHEAQDPQQNANCFSADIFDCPHINCLTIITQPVAKVDLCLISWKLPQEMIWQTYSFHVKLGEFLATSSTSHHNGKKYVFNVAMPKCGTFDF